MKVTSCYQRAVHPGRSVCSGGLPSCPRVETLILYVLRSWPKSCLNKLPLGPPFTTLNRRPLAHPKGPRILPTTGGGRGDRVKPVPTPGPCNIRAALQPRISSPGGSRKVRVRRESAQGGARAEENGPRRSAQLDGAGSGQSRMGLDTHRGNDIGRGGAYRVREKKEQASEECRELFCSCF